MINEALRLIRVFHDLKQFELADRLKVSKSHISEIESGNWLPSSIAREVEFVHSHTVHHHALIAEKLSGE